MIDLARSPASEVALPPALEAALGPALLPLMAQADVAVSIKDVASNTLAYVNGPFAAMFARPAAELVGQADAALLDGTPSAALRNAELSALSREGASAGEIKLGTAQGVREFRIVRLPLRIGDAARPTHLCALWYDLGPQRARETQLKLALTQLEQQQRANDQLRREMGDSQLRDQVTGLYTRAHFDDQLRREVDLSTREHREFALVAIALDPPSEAVRAKGVEGATRVLEALGRLLRGNTRVMDASCRVDEARFAVLLSGVGLATAHSRMEGLRRQCATQIVPLAGEELGFTVSMGVASFPHTAATQDEILSACDAALAESQRRGGNNVTLASIKLG